MNKDKFSEIYSKWSPSKKIIRGREVSGDTPSKPTNKLEVKPKRTNKRRGEA